ncbi:MAG: hypothetical protein IJE43_26065 [Alphaproteobacteria bacterium]|nr:hypothetical protein [Alphaproteobacteria bacterium]
MSKELKYPSQETIIRLTKELQLEGADDFTQDWECEVANVEQLQSYIEYYQKANLNVNEKATLMRIILEAYNDLVTLNTQECMYQNMIKQLLQYDYSIHERTIRYWSCEGEDLENCFAITAFIRSVSDCE